MSKTISVVFNADTQQFVTNVDRASQSVAKASQAVADAKNKITASYKEQMAAAKAAGASQEELAAITRRAAQMRLQAEEDAQTKLKADQQSYLSGRYSKLQAAAARETNLIRTQLDEQTRLAQAAALRRDIQSRNASPALGPLSNLSSLFGQSFKSPVTEEAAEVAGSIERVGQAAEHSVTGTQAASAAIRALEGGFTNNIRAAERFAASIGPLAGLLESAFPLVGAAALGAAIFKMGQEAYDTYLNVVKLTGAIKSLDQAQLSVDKSVAGFRDQTETSVEAILERTQGHSASLQQHLQYQANKPLSLAEYFNGDAVAKLPSDVKGNYADLYSTIAPDQVPERLARITKEVGNLRNALEFNQQGLFGEAVTSVGDFGMNGTRNATDYMQARLTLAKQIQSQLQGASDARVSGLQSTQSDLGAQQQQDAKDAMQKAEEASRKATEAARRVAETQRQNWEHQFKTFSAQYQRSADELRDWWLRIEKSGAVLPMNRDFVQDKVAETSGEARTKDAEGDKRWMQHDSAAIQKYFEDDHEQWEAAKTRSAKDEQDYWDLLALTFSEGSDNFLWAQRKAAEATKEINKQWEEAQRARIKVAQDLATMQASLAEKWLAMEQQTGRISRPDALAQTANIHAQESATRMAALQAELARQQGIDPDSAGTVEAQAAVTKAAAERQLQIMQDASAMAGATWQGALQNATAAWVLDAEDGAKEVTALFGQVMGSVNDNLANLMVGKKANWSDSFRSIGKTVANDGLKAGEAPLLKALGLGKADGSSDNPFWVRFKGSVIGSGKGTSGAASGVGNGASSALDGLTALLSGGNGSDGDSDAGSTNSTATQASTGSKVAAGIIGGLGKMLGAFGGMFGGGKALGGGVQAGVAYDVGEMGRERFVPSTDGMIVPAHALGGDSATYQISVGHGVTPTEFEMKLQQALQAYHKSVMPAGAVAAVQNHNQRSTSAARR